VTLEWGTLTVRYTRQPGDPHRLDGVAYLLDEAAGDYGYLLQKPNGPYQSPLCFGYASVGHDIATLPDGLTLSDENGWDEWELTVPPEQIENVWKTCIPAWKAAIRLEGGV